MSKFKLISLAVGFSLALALTSSCSSGDDGSGSNSSSSQNGEIIEPSSSSSSVLSSSSEEMMLSGSSSSFEVGSSSSVALFSSSSNSIVRNCAVDYNESTEFCIDNDKIYPLCNGNKYDVLTTGCCDNSTYTFSTHGCIGNIILTKCGSEYFGSETHFCPNNPMSKFFHTVLEKCDGATYNPDYNGCCNNVIFILSTYDCINNTVLTKCGNGHYASETHFCSSNTIYEKCNGATYNPSTQDCINNVVLNKCGSGRFDPETHFCVSNTAYEKCNGLTYTPSTQGCINNVVLNKCGSSHFDPETHFCVSNIIYKKCNGATYNPSTQGCVNNVVLPKCGSGYFAPETHFCVNNTIYEKCNGTTYIPSAQGCLNDVVIPKCDSDYIPGNAANKGTLVDSRETKDVKTYKTIKICSQIWMAENLNYNAPGSRCGEGNGLLTDKNTEICNIYGRLYEWQVAMGYYTSGPGSSAVPSGLRGICPTGWHIPSDAEWDILIHYVSFDWANMTTDGTAGTKLKANSDLWDTNAGTDTYGFSALPGGNGFGNANPGLGIFGGWWSTTISSYPYSDYRYGRSVSNSSEDVSRFTRAPTNLYSVRCVRDL